MLGTLYNDFNIAASVNSKCMRDFGWEYNDFIREMQL
jgi:hypothetical protein